MKLKFSSLRAFTLPEVLIAVSIFSVVAMLVSSMYIQSFRQSRRTNIQNQIYADARFVMQRIAQEIRTNMIDYDEYYNQNVVIPSIPGGSVPNPGLKHYGQNYGRYFSSFFHPGSEEKLGFDCNNGTRNDRNCTQLRRSIDVNTGMNPFTGKYDGAAEGDEDAFCANVSYDAPAVGNPANVGPYCQGDAPSAAKKNTIGELYLISADARKKTILARELIAGTSTAPVPVYALSLLKLDGVDDNSDNIPDHFVCAPEFQCRGGSDFDVVGTSTALDLVATDASCFGGSGAPQPADLPRLDDLTKEPNPALETCDTSARGFAMDFVPISPLQINITSLNFIVTPAENPNYAFAEPTALIQPRVTVMLTAQPNPLALGLNESFDPITLEETFFTQSQTPIPAPLLAE
ncbi:MAG: prepilin-type N-terminal cleavage/methylation domain-containing protein [Patescibacteria group bacterium]